MADSMYCEHDRMADACEECAYAAAKDAGRPVPDRLYQPVPVSDEADEQAATRGAPSARPPARGRRK